MGNFLLALVIVFGGWWLMRKFANSQPKQMRQLLRKLAGGGIAAAGLFLLFKGASNVGLPMIVLGTGLIGETSLFPGGIRWPGSEGGAGPGNQRQQQGERPGPMPPVRAAMSRDEALAVLGLSKTSAAADVNEAYKRLMKDYHPDRGGSDYLAAKINQARDVLLQEFGAST